MVVDAKTFAFVKTVHNLCKDACRIGIKLLQNFCNFSNQHSDFRPHVEIEDIKVCNKLCKNLCKHFAKCVKIALFKFTQQF